MKKYFLTFLLLLGIFIIRNSYTLNARNSYDYDHPDREYVNDFNNSRDVVINKNFKPVETKYKRLIIKFYNGFTNFFAGTHDINYTIYKYEGEGHNYYMFFYNTLASPDSEYNGRNGYYFNGKAQTTIKSDKGELIKWDPNGKPNESRSTLSIGFSGNSPSISYNIDFDHSELSIYNNVNTNDKRFSVEYSYNRSGWDYFWNRVPSFLWNPHTSVGSAIFKTKKYENPKFKIEFYGQMNYSHKYFDAWHTTNERIIEIN